MKLKFNKKTTAAERRMLSAVIRSATTLPRGYEYITFSDGAMTIARIVSDSLSIVVVEF